MQPPMEHGLNADSHPCSIRVPSVAGEIDFRKNQRDRLEKSDPTLKDLHFAGIGGQAAATVVEGHGDFVQAETAPRGGAVKDDVGHLAAAQTLGALLKIAIRGERCQVFRVLCHTGAAVSSPTRSDSLDQGDQRATPSFFIRLRKVLGWRPRIWAAPRGPLITQLVCWRTARM